MRSACGRLRVQITHSYSSCSAGTPGMLPVGRDRLRAPTAEHDSPRGACRSAPDPEARLEQETLAEGDGVLLRAAAAVGLEEHDAGGAPCELSAAEHAPLLALHVEGEQICPQQHRGDIERLGARAPSLFGHPRTEPP